MHQLFLQQVVADTTTASYQIGYKIGTWLPVIALLVIYILILFAGRKRGEG